MLNIFKVMATKYERYMTYMGKVRAREVMLQMSDRMLEDTGISRELLEQGVSAWPWKASSLNSGLKPIVYKKIQTKQAVEELTSYSDRDLHDLGITRGSIKEAVLYGRHGIERQEEKDAA